MYILREGTVPGVAVYSVCEDESYAQAELMTLASRIPEGRKVFGYYDVDPKYSVRKFLRGYKGRTAEYKFMMACRERIATDGWQFPEAPEV